MLNWAGKSEAFRALQTPTTSTLAPVKDESINFEDTENIFVEGENLEALKVLQKAYYGKIKMIYIDPPYNTGNDSFVYPDKFSESREEYLKRINDKDEEGMMMREGMFRKNSKDSGHYHSNWLSMMYPRLFMARNLLRDDGAIFISIDDNEVHNLRLLMNEIFGEENFISQITVQSNPRGRQSESYVASVHEYVLIYSKNYPECDIVGIPLTYEQTKDFDLTEKDGRKYRLLGLRQRGSASLREERPDMFFPIFINPKTEEISLKKVTSDYVEVIPKKSTGQEGRWMWGRKKVEDEIELLVPKLITGRNEWDIFVKDYLDRDGNERRRKVKSLWAEKELNYQNGKKEFKELFGDAYLDYPKPKALISRMIRMINGSGEVILDFFAGSCTTADALLDVNIEDDSNHQFIMIQFAESLENKKANSEGLRTIADVGIERIKRAIKRKIKNDPLFAESRIDLGVKVFKLKQSNFKLWRGDGIEGEEELEKQLDLLLDPVRPEALEENMLFELLLKSGYPLTTKIEKRETSEGHYYLVDGELAIALSHLNRDIIENMLEAAPQQVICLDSLFGDDDPLKTNTQLQFKDAGIKFQSI